jgi:hypothetical protein
MFVNVGDLVVLKNFYTGFSLTTDAGFRDFTADDVGIVLKVGSLDVTIVSSRLMYGSLPKATLKRLT